ncbi:MAG: DNA-3-methyladenine glycosylase 2 family protein [Oscillospiraceae bacterium]|nr:DNA-3-methyladenine glycosylase 2 family protein [Oscillospiraceae bacterium]
MQYIEHRNKDEVEIQGVSDFDLVRIFECGQCFRWDMEPNGDYTGVAMGRAARLRKVGESVFISGNLAEFESVWQDYFDLDRDYAAIRVQQGVDDFMRQACEFGAGIRILRQDKWEALCSFIISQCNNIPRIKKIVGALCELYGEPFEFEDGTRYTFPSAERIAVLTAKDLAPIKCGYRAGYIIGAAKAVADGSLDLDALAQLSPQDARSELKKLYGVGDKVADCAVLFGLHMLDAFPRDVWIKRAIADIYGKGFDPGIFAPYAGIAQQYMFYYIRSTAKSRL